MSPVEVARVAGINITCGWRIGASPGTPGGFERRPHGFKKRSPICDRAARGTIVNILKRHGLEPAPGVRLGGHHAGNPDTPCGQVNDEEDVRQARAPVHIFNGEIPRREDPPVRLQKFLPGRPSLWLHGTREIAVDWRLTTQPNSDEQGDTQLKSRSPEVLTPQHSDKDARGRSGTTVRGFATSFRSYCGHSGRRARRTVIRFRDSAGLADSYGTRARSPSKNLA